MLHLNLSDNLVKTLHRASRLTQMRRHITHDARCFPLFVKTATRDWPFSMGSVMRKYWDGSSRATASECLRQRCHVTSLRLSHSANINSINVSKT